MHTIMTANTVEDSVLLQKTRELCETLAGQPEFESIRSRVDLFMINDQAKEQYQLVSAKGEHLQHKQAQGAELSPEEIADFEQQRDALFRDPVARGFLDAQQEMHRIQETIAAYVGKTFELGRVPAVEDFDSGSCGPTCGCGH